MLANGLGDSMFEVLVYMFENYLEANIRLEQDDLMSELSAAGFDQHDIDGAFDWFSTLEKMSTQAVDGVGHLGDGHRAYTDAEMQKMTTESLSFMLFLEQAKVLNSVQRELVLDRIMALPQPEVRIEEMRMIVLMALWNQGRAQDYLFVEDAMFGDRSATIH